MSIYRAPRSLSQRNYALVAEIRANADRLRQIDKGLGYASPNISRTRVGADGRRLPLFIGPELELKVEAEQPLAA